MVAGSFQPQAEAGSGLVIVVAVIVVGQWLTTCSIVLLMLGVIRCISGFSSFFSGAL